MVRIIFNLDQWSTVFIVTYSQLALKWEKSRTTRTTRTKTGNATMLTAIQVERRVKVLAVNAERSEAPFACPACGDTVTLKKGKIKVHHFAHKPPVTCEAAAGETSEHIRAKMEIYEALRKSDTVDPDSVELEKSFGVARADVFARILNQPVAIEIQRSNLTVNKIQERTIAYHKLGVHVLWIGLPPREGFGDRHTPKAWEKWCHAAYMGRVYYWLSGEQVVPVHFGKYDLWVEYGESEHGGGGGYFKPSKRWKIPKPGNPVEISQKFKPVIRSAWSGGNVSIPACRLYQDESARWWDNE